jgi:membrane protease YdiL (CAAX protease family)
MIVALLYLVGIAAAELVTALVNTVGGIVFHSVLLFSLIVHSSFVKRPSHKLYLSMALAPLIGIVSLSLPLSQFTEIYWYLITAVPLFVATFTCSIILDFQPADIGLSLRERDIPLQGLVALTGISFGLVEYYILKPEPLVSSLTLGRVLLPALIFLASGFVEELAFRGVMQRSAVEALGRWGWVYIAALFSVLSIGYLSAAHSAFVFLVGLFFGWVVQKTGSLLGVSLSHGITNIVLYVILPLVIA